MKKKGQDRLCHLPKVMLRLGQHFSPENRPVNTPDHRCSQPSMLSLTLRFHRGVFNSFTFFDFHFTSGTQRPFSEWEEGWIQGVRMRPKCIGSSFSLPGVKSLSQGWLWWLLSPADSLTLTVSGTVGLDSSQWPSPQWVEKLGSETSGHVSLVSDVPLDTLHQRPLDVFNASTFSLHQHPSSQIKHHWFPFQIV